MRRVPDPDSSRWVHMCLYLSTKDKRGGVWMEEFKFLAAYRLKPTVSTWPMIISWSTIYISTYLWSQIEYIDCCDTVVSLYIQDILEFRPKYRPMVFELRVHPHDQPGDLDGPYCSPELLVAQDTFVSEVVELLCHTA